MRRRNATDTMDKWDEEKLRSVILSKHGNLRTTTDVSKMKIPWPSNSFDFGFISDRMQIFHRGRRDTKVKGHQSFHPAFDHSHLHRSRFGWFWQCPNGELCQYRHALPPGFVLKSQKKALEEAEKANQISLEEFLEVEVRPFFFRVTSTAQWHLTSLSLPPGSERSATNWDRT